MKIKDFKNVIYSNTGDIQWGILWCRKTGSDVVNNCSVEYIYKNYGDLDCYRICAEGVSIVFCVEEVENV